MRECCNVEKARFLGKGAIFLGALEVEASSELTERGSGNEKWVGFQDDYLQGNLWSC